MKTNVAKSDVELKTDVLAELKYEPSVKITDIGVLVKAGVVTLNGYATSYGEKCDAVRATKRVAGVKAIADDITVQLPDSHRHTDGDIATVASNQIAWSTMIPAGTAKVTVRDGWITLEGQVEWRYQKEAADRAVEYLMGVKGLTNLITIKPQLSPEKIESALNGAFERNALLDARKIQVSISGNEVILRGKVSSYAERDEAERVTWAAPGVFTVDNQLELDHPAWDFAE